MNLQSKTVPFLGAKSPLGLACVIDIYIVIKKLKSRCFNSAPVFQECVKGVLRVFQGCFNGVSWLFQRCVKGISRACIYFVVCVQS